MDKSKQPWQCEVVVHTFNISDVEDPDLWAAQSLYDFEKSEKGEWIMTNSLPTASWHRQVDHNTMGYKFQVRAYLSPEQLTYYKLKYE
jgi:hypothetical protein